MEYNIKENGDHLEKEFSHFIQTYLSTYEAVWKLYIGNKGNDTKADIEGYPFDRDIKRQKFSEHTYTILQSAILLNRLITNGIFGKPFLNTTSDILDLQDYLLLFFTHLGRIRDNVEEASSCLLETDTKEITNMLDEFYHKRHILVHGKMLPIIFKANGEISLPVLSKNSIDISGWYHKEHFWPDILLLPTENLADTVNKLYWDLLPKLKEIFGTFKKKIESELNASQFKLKYENHSFPEINRHGSGSTNKTMPSIYGIPNNNPNIW